MVPHDRFDVAVIGGGPGGSVAAMTIAAAGYSVALLEKDSFPREKLCGEFLSAEVVRTISDLGLHERFQELRPNPIATFKLVPARGRAHSASLGFGAYGVKRSKLDSMLLEGARAGGVRIFQPAEAKEVESTRNGYLLRCSSQGKKWSCESRWVVGAFGRYPAPKRETRTTAAAVKTGFNGFKFHLPAEGLLRSRKDEILLALGEGMYCGISFVGDDTVTLCVLEKRRTGDPGPREKLKEFIRRSPAFEGARQPELARLLDALPIYGAGNLSFGRGSAIRDGLLLVGDAAGMIAPLAGDGIGIAVEQGRLLGNLFAGARPDLARREAFFDLYRIESSRIFSQRVAVAKACQQVLLSPALQSVLFPFLALSPSLLNAAIRGTRGVIEISPPNYLHLSDSRGTLGTRESVVS